MSCSFYCYGLNLSATEDKYSSSRSYSIDEVLAIKNFDGSHMEEITFNDIVLDKKVVQFLNFMLSKKTNLVLILSSRANIKDIAMNRNPAVNTNPHIFCKFESIELDIKQLEVLSVVLRQYEKLITLNGLNSHSRFLCRFFYTGKLRNIELSEHKSTFKITRAQEQLFIKAIASSNVIIVPTLFDENILFLTNHLTLRSKTEDRINKRVSLAKNFNPKIIVPEKGNLEWNLLDRMYDFKSRLDLGSSKVKLKRLLTLIERASYSRNDVKFSLHFLVNILPEGRVTLTPAPSHTFLPRVLEMLPECGTQA